MEDALGQVGTHDGHARSSPPSLSALIRYKPLFTANRFLHHPQFPIAAGTLQVEVDVRSTLVSNSEGHQFSLISAAS